MPRRFLVLLHRWFGLSAAAFLFVAGATGAVVAWDHELDEWLNPAFFLASTPGPVRPATELANRLEGDDPRIRISYLELTIEPGKALTAFVAPRNDPATGLPYEPGFNQVAIDPVSGAVQGRRDWGKASLSREQLIPFLYKLHYSLHLPVVGGTDLGMLLMGCVAVAWVFDMVIALWISFPRLKDWRRSFAFRWSAGGHRLRFDLHRSGGVWLYPLLLVAAVTSVALNLEHEVMRPLVSRFSSLSSPPRGEGAGLEPVAPTAVTLQRAIDTAAAHARQRGWAVPAGGVSVRPDLGLYAVGFFAAGESHGNGGLGPPWLYVDARTGAVLGTKEPGVGSAGDVFMHAMFPLHSGRILGTAGRIAVSVLGVAVATLSVTGVWIWARKRRAQSASMRLRRTPSRVADSQRRSAPPARSHPPTCR